MVPNVASTIRPCRKTIRDLPGPKSTRPERTPARSARTSSGTGSCVVSVMKLPSSERGEDLSRTSDTTSFTKTGLTR